MSGVGSSESFVMLVNKYFNNILRFYNFSDHYDYHKNQKQIGKILQKNSSCLGLVTTLKDYVKIIQLPNLLAQRPIIYVVDIDLRIAADAGKPLVEHDPNHKMSKIFIEMAKEIKKEFLQDDYKTYGSVL